jgi:hypothetical protein
MLVLSLHNSVMERWIAFELRGLKKCDLTDPCDADEWTVDRSVDETASIRASWLSARDPQIVRCFWLYIVVFAGDWRKCRYYICPPYFFQTEKRIIVEKGRCLRTELYRKRSVYRAIQLLRYWRFSRWCSWRCFSGTMVQSTRRHIPVFFNLGTILVAEVKCQELSVPYLPSYSGLFWHCIC